MHPRGKVRWRTEAVHVGGDSKSSLDAKGSLSQRSLRSTSVGWSSSGEETIVSRSCFRCLLFWQIGFQNYCMLLRDGLQALTLFLLWLGTFQCGIFQVDAAGFFREKLGADNADLAVLRIVIAFWNRGSLGFLLWGCRMICGLFGLRLGRGNACDARVGPRRRRLVGRGMIWQRLRRDRLLLLPLHFLMIGCHVATA